MAQQPQRVDKSDQPGEGRIIANREERDIRIVVCSRPFPCNRLYVWLNATCDAAHLWLLIYVRTIFMYARSDRARFASSGAGPAFLGPTIARTGSSRGTTPVGIRERAS